MKTLTRLGGVAATTALLIGMLGVTPAQAARCGRGGCPVDVSQATTKSETSTTTTTIPGTTAGNPFWGTTPGNPQTAGLPAQPLSAAQQAAIRRANVQRDFYGITQGQCGVMPAPACATPPPAAPVQQAVAPGTPAQTVTTTTVTVEEVIEKAKAKITFDNPEIGSAPCAGEGCQGSVGIPVWLWTQDLPTQNATASVGGKSITVTDKVTSVTWDLGNGTSITCNGSGTAFDPSMGWGDSPDCGVPGGYTKAGRYTVTATFHHDISWSGDATGNETAATTSSTNVVIGEVQAIGVNAGSGDV